MTKARRQRVFRDEALVVGAVCLLVLLASACAAGIGDPGAEAATRHCARATRLYYEEDVDAAVAELERALELRPDHAGAHHLLGLLHFGRGRLGPAAAHLERAVALDPELYDARADLGTVYLAEHRWREAVEVFGVLTETPAFDARQMAHARLGWALHKLARYREAARHYRMAIYLAGPTCQNYGQLGLAYEGMGDRPMALDAWQHAASYCPGDPEPFFHLGRLLALSGDTARASAAFRRCHALEPGSPFGRRCAALGP